MDKKTALMVIHARMLGASFRRIAELLGEDSKQSTGMDLVAEASTILNIDIDLVEMEGNSFGYMVETLHQELGVRFSPEV
jgi:PDZ domain-containing secreted protein